MGPGTEQHQAKFWTRGTFFAQALFLLILSSPRFVFGGFILAIKMILVHQLFLNIPLIQVVVVH